MSARVRLHRVQGTPITLHFSPGYQARAQRLGALVEAAHRFLEGWLGVEAHTTLSLLRRESWRHLRRAPYGYPHSNPSRATLYTPAHYPPRLIKQGLALYEAAPLPLQQRVPGVVEQPEAQVAAFYDLVVVHELGHLFIHHLALALGTRWLTELVANLFATAFFLEERPDLADTWLAWAEIQASQTVPFRTLDDYESQYVMLDFGNASYYQGRFNLEAARLWRAQGRALALRLIEHFSQRPDILLQRFQQVAPTFTWAEGTQEKPPTERKV